MTIQIFTQKIYEAVVVSIHEKLSNIIIESGSQIAIQIIICAIKAPGIISNVVKDIIMLTSTVRNTSFNIVRDTPTDLLIE